MKTPGFIPGLAAVCLLAAPGAVLAQFWPGNPYYGGGWGGYPASQYNTSRMIAAQDRQVGQEAAIGQNMVVQSGIRNTLTTQAQDRTNAILSQQQSNQDWWFQTQQQQMAQQRAQAYPPPAPGAGFEPSGPAAPEPQVATDVIPWPPLLQDPAFASRRALIEAPYRRSPPGLSAPTKKDYREMARTADEMKAILEGLISERGDISTADYRQAKAFLDKLKEEARDRAADQASPNSR